MTLVFFPDAEHECLAIRSGFAPGSTESARLIKRGLPHAVIIDFSGDQASGHQIWRPTAWREIEGETALCGPFLQGAAFETLCSCGAEETLNRLKKLLSAYLYAAKNNLQLPPPGATSTLFLSSGDILFNSVHYSFAIRRTNTPLQHLQVVEDYSEFRQKSILTLLSRCLSGSLHAEVNPYKGIKPYLYQPALPAELSARLYNALYTNRSMNEEELLRLLEVCTTLVREKKLQLPPAETPGLRQAVARHQRKQRFLTGLTRNRSKLITSAVLLGAIAFLVISGMGNAGVELDLAGYGPEKIVALYYDSFNSLDHIAMNEITRSGAARNEIRSILQIDLSSKVFEGQAMEPAVISPLAYQRGRAPSPFQNIFGITELTVQELRRSNDEAVYYVEAVQWAPMDINPDAAASLDEFDQIMQQAPDIRRIRRGDTVRVVQGRRGWQIQALEFRLIDELDPIPRSKLIKEWQQQHGVADVE